MKQLKYNLVFIIAACLAFGSCDKYLDVQPKGRTLLTTVPDFDQWLNDPTLNYGHGAPYGHTNYMADNVDMNVSNPPALGYEMMYVWAPQFSIDLEEPPALWGEHYAKINHYNTVLLGIDAATGGTNAQKRSLKAEALLGRALEYFYLVNEYGKPYDSTTAATDLAVPFVTSNDVTQVVPGRSTVAEIHDQIISDIQTAIPDLADDNRSNRLRASKAAGHSVLARIFLYARNYEEARRNAERALVYPGVTMIDYNGTLPESNLLSLRPDVIYGRIIGGSMTPTLDFMRSFPAGDRRVRMLYRSSDGYNFVTPRATIFFPSAVTPALGDVNTGTSLPEMKLIIAECAARSNDLAVALQHLDDIRKNRIAPASYTRFESNDQEEVLQEVLKERRHELPFNGLRWFDMRRLDKENRMDTVYRYDAQGNVVATLPPHSDRYTLQIPVQVMSFNPGMQQNP